MANQMNRNRAAMTAAAMFAGDTFSCADTAANRSANGNIAIILDAMILASIFVACMILASITLICLISLLGLILVLPAVWKDPRPIRV